MLNHSCLTEQPALNCWYNRLLLETIFTRIYGELPSILFGWAVSIHTWMHTYTQPICVACLYGPLIRCLFCCRKLRRCSLSVPAIGYPPADQTAFLRSESPCCCRPDEHDHDHEDEDVARPFPFLSLSLSLSLATWSPSFRSLEPHRPTAISPSINEPIRGIPSVVEQLCPSAWMVGRSVGPIH